MRSINILGVKYDDMSIAEAVERSIQAMEERIAAYVLPVGSSLLLEADKNKRLMTAIKGAGLVLADDKGIQIASGILGLPLKHKMSGADFADALLARMSEEGMSVFVFGGRAGEAETAADSILDRFPGIEIVGTASGDFVEDEEIKQSIDRARPDLLLTCLSSPRQEHWLYENCEGLNVGMAFALGESIVEYAPRRENDSFGARLMNDPRETLKVPRAVTTALVKRIIGRN